MHALGSNRVTIPSDGEPAVMRVAAAVRDATRTEVSTTTPEVSAPGNDVGTGLAEKAVSGSGGWRGQNTIQQDADASGVDDHRLDDLHGRT